MNKIMGYFDILNAIFMGLMIYMYSNAASTISSNNNFTTASAVVAIILTIAIILHIVAITKSKNNTLALIGNVIGILAAGLFLFRNVLGLYAMILFIIAAILILISERKA